MAIVVSVPARVPIRVLARVLIRVLASGACGACCAQCGTPDFPHCFVTPFHVRGQPTRVKRGAPQQPSADGPAQPMQEAWLPGQADSGLDNCQWVDVPPQNNQ